MAATDRVGIEVEVLGYDGAMAEMKALEKEMKGLGGRSVKVKVEARVEDLQKNLKALRSQKVTIQTNVDKIDKDIRQLQQRIQRLQRSKMRFMFNAAGITKVNNRITELQNKVNVLKSNRLTLQSDLGKVNGEIRETTSEITRLQQALRNVKSMSLGQAFSNVSSTVSHVGQAMQSAGNALTRIGNPISNLMKSTVWAGGFAAFGKVSEGISSGFSRYDTMKKYPKMMEKFNTENYNATKSIDDLEKSVRGLPTGLDEIVEVAQRFTLTTGDLEEGTNLAIAANNAFLASMSTDTQRYQGMMQLQDLLNGKQLSSTEWNSLIESMSAGINEVGKQLGYADDEMDTFRRDLLANEISGKDFLNALKEVGTGEGEIAKLAENSKDTWEAFTQNVGTAFSRMTEGIIESFDEIVKIATGGKFDSVNRLLSDKVIGQIDKMAASVKGWIKANPKKITDFFESLKGVDWKGLGRGFVEGFGLLASGIKKIADALGGQSLEKIGKILPFLAPLGTGLTIGGGLLKGSRHILGGIGTILLGFARGMGRAFRGLGKVFSVGALTKVGSGIIKFVDKLKDFRKVEKATSEAKGVAKTASKNAGSIKSYFGKIGKALGGLFAAEIGITSISATGWVNVKIIKDMLKDFVEIGDIVKDIDVDGLKDAAKIIAPIEGIIAAIGGAVGGLTAAGVIAPEALGFFSLGLGAVELLITSITGAAWLNTKLIEGSLKNFVKATEYVQQIADNINAMADLDIDTDGVENAITAISDVSDLFSPSGRAKYLGHGMVEKGKDNGLMSSGDAKEMKKVFGYIDELIESIKNSADTLKYLEGLEVDIDAAKANAETVIGSLQELLNTLDADFELRNGEDVKATKSANTIVENITETISTINGSVEDIKSLAETEIDFWGAKSAIHGLARQMGSLYDEIYNAFYVETVKHEGTQGAKDLGGKAYTQRGGITKQTVSDTGMLSTIMGNINSMITSLKQAYDSVVGENGLETISTENFKNMMGRATTLVETIRASWEEIQPKLQEFESMADTMEFTGKGLTGISDVLVQLRQMSDQLMDEDLGLGDIKSYDFSYSLLVARGMIESLSTFWDGLDEALGTFEGAETQTANIETVINAVKQVKPLLQELQTISENFSMQGAGGNPLMPASIPTLGGAGGVATALGAISDIIDKIAQINAKIQEAEITDMSAKVEQITASLESLRSLMQAAQGFSGENANVGFEGFGNGAFATGGGFTSITMQLEGIKPLITKINEINAQIQGVQAADVTGKVNEIIVSMKAIKRLITEAAGFSGEGGSLGNASSVFDSVSQGLKQLTQSIKAFGQGFSTSLIQGMNFGAVRAQAITGIASVASAIGAQSGKFRAAGARLGRATVEGIRSQLRSVSVNVGIHAHAYLASLSGIGAVLARVRSAVNTTVSASVGVASAIRRQNGGVVHRANGGAIYRAKGGSTFKKRGTDTVPAMLTPGEFVHKKKAVDYFGLEFMRRVNNLDLAGAMRALSAKAGRNTSIARSTVINNNTTNNNTANVNQQIYTSNPNFAFRRSNRYVQAL